MVRMRAVFKGKSFAHASEGPERSMHGEARATTRIFERLVEV